MMIHPAESLLRYDNPVLISKSTDRKSPKVSLPGNATRLFLAKRSLGKLGPVLYIAHHWSTNVSVNFNAVPCIKSL